MSCTVQETRFGFINIHTRIPFRYGIAVMTEVPHMIVRVRMEIDGKTAYGYSADNLAPKWFTKNPEQSFADEIADMRRVARHAADLAAAAGPSSSVFALWERVYHDQSAWGKAQGLPVLLTQFGVSLIERAMIDAYCRASGLSFARALDSGALGLRLGAIHPELEQTTSTDYLPSEPLQTISVRHTVGLSDPLDASELTDWTDDGLPADLESVITHYGIRFFKLKVGGNITDDVQRLSNIIRIIQSKRGNDFYYSIDGNEQYPDMLAVRELWEKLTAVLDADALERLLFIEQPIHRKAALNPEIKAQLEQWQHRPPIIIDESDAGFDALREALDLGYTGTSHKNCKGVFKGIANACLLIARQRKSGIETILSGEDLTNVGPVALLQDLTVMARLNVPHLERNGFHYFKGIDYLPESARQLTQRNHPDLYKIAPDQSVTLLVEKGSLNLNSLQNPSLGMAAEFDFDWCIPEENWTFESLQSKLP